MGAGPGRKKGSFPLKMGIVSPVSRLALKHCLCFVQPCSRQDTQPLFPGGFPRKAASLELECCMWGGQQCHHSIPGQGGQGGTGKERSCASPRDWDGPWLPHQTSVLKGPEGSPKEFPLKMHLSPGCHTLNKSSQIHRELSTLRDALMTHSATENLILLNHRPAPFSPFFFYEASRKPGGALDKFLKAWCHL